MRITPSWAATIISFLKSAMAHLRSGIILIEDDRVALIERVNARGRYYLFPGGSVEAGETAETAAIREAQEELGVAVELISLAAIVDFNGREQRYYVAKRIGGSFGRGTGAELSSAVGSAAGSYKPVWMERKRLTTHTVRPAALAAFIASNALSVGSMPIQIRETD